MNTKKYEGPKTQTTREHEKAFKRAMNNLKAGKPLADVVIRLRVAYGEIPTVVA